MVFDPPWRFDPYQNPKTVAWGGVYVLMQFFGAEPDDLQHSVSFTFPHGGSIVFQRSQSLGPPGGRFYEGIFLLNLSHVSAEFEETAAFVVQQSGCLRQEGVGDGETVKVVSIGHHDGGPGFVPLPPSDMDAEGVGVAYTYAMLVCERADGSTVQYAIDAYVKYFGSGHAQTDDVLVRGSQLSSSIFSYSDTTTSTVIFKGFPGEWTYSASTTTVNLPGMATIPAGEPFVSEWPLDFQAYVFAPSSAWVTAAGGGISDKYYPIRRREQPTNTNQLDGTFNCFLAGGVKEQQQLDGKIPFILRRAKYQRDDDDGEHMLLELYPGRSQASAQQANYNVGRFRKTINGHYFVSTNWNGLPMGSGPPLGPPSNFIDTGIDPNVP